MMAMMTPKEMATAVKLKAAEIAKLTDVDLLAVWERLPGVMSTTPPKGAKRIAESVAYYLVEMGENAPPDLDQYIATAPKLRDSSVVPPVVESSGNADAHTVPSSPGAADTGPETTSKSNIEETDMQTETATNGAGKAKRSSSKKKATAPVKAKAKGKAAKPAAKKDGASRAPREGTIASKIRELTLAGKDTPAIAKEVAKAFPDTKFGKEDEAGQARFVAWAQWDARRKKLLPEKAKKEAAVKAAPKTKAAKKK